MKRGRSFDARNGERERDRLLAATGSEDEDDLVLDPFVSFLSLLLLWLLCLCELRCSDFEALCAPRYAKKQH